MEAERRGVNYFKCRIACIKQGLLHGSKHLIRFDSGQGAPQSLEEWEQCQNRIGPQNAPPLNREFG